MLQERLRNFHLIKIIGRIIGIVLGVLGLGVILLMLLFSSLNQTNGEIESSGQKRRYLLYVPKSYQPLKPTPLVISIHGYAEWPAHQMQISRWNDLADQYGFIVVYPSGTGFPLHWSASGPAGASPGATSDSEKEVRFISDLIDRLEQQYNLDPSRIFANGLSIGGGMSFLLACRLSERINAIGSVAGAYLLPWTGCQPTRPVPLIAFHGTSDPIVPYTGGRSSAFNYPFPVVPDWMLAYARRNGCDDHPVDLPAAGEASGVLYRHCDQNADVIFYTIQGGGHAWPGGVAMPAFIVGHTTQDIDATRLMWEFFDRQPPLKGKTP